MDTSRISLDGAWRFVHSTDMRPGSRPTPERTIQVPGPWQAQFADLRMKGGVGIYRREVEIPDGWLDERRVFLRFGAVFHNTRVSVNGAPVGAHEGGFLPFGFDITEHLAPGPNTFEVRAESPTDDAAVFPETPLGEIPFGKQSWYGPLSGIWQPVYLERRHADHIASMRLLPDLVAGRLRGTVVFDAALSAPAEVQIDAVDPMGSVVASVSLHVTEGTAGLGFEVAVPDVRPWSPDSPKLYIAQASLRRDGELVDAIHDRFGFRSFEARGGRFYLNGEPFYLRGALDQDYYPETICTVPSVEFLEDQFRKAKQLGLNCVRCHIKAADPRYYEAADRVGLLVWTELPNGGLSTERSRGRKERLLKGIVDRDGNHPSIAIWTIINENWGVDLVHDAGHRAWLKRTYAWLKSYDPTRLVVDNSPLAPSFHLQSDIADYHYYAAIPDHRHAWDRFVEKLAGRPASLFSPEGDATSTGDEPRMCSEFGNWGLPFPGDLRDENGAEPWWFETGHDWGEGVMYAHGAENRFADWNLDRAFGSFDHFVEDAQWQQYRALKYQIESMRRRPELAGYCITELTDCHWESNGLLDMRRNRRVFHDAFGAINADTVIVPAWERLSAWAGERIPLRLKVAHGAGAAIEGATLDVFLGGTQVLPAPRIEPGAVVDLGRIELVAPAEEQACVHRVLLELRDARGAILATNHLDLAVHPARGQAPDLGGLLVWSPDSRLRRRLGELGFALAGSIDTAQIIVAAEAKAAMAARVRDGCSLLLLPERDTSLYPFFPHWQNVRIRSREETPWQGDWASSFAWLNRAGVFADMPGGPLLDESFDRVIPTHVITGCNLIDFQARVHAGMVVGWVHKPVALSVERAYGRGKLIASTFRLFRDAPGADPTATRLLDGLLTLAAGRAVGRMREPAVAEMPMALPA